MREVKEFVVQVECLWSTSGSTVVSHGDSTEAFIGEAMKISRWLTSSTCTHRILGKQASCLTISYHVCSVFVCWEGLLDDSIINVGTVASSCDTAPITLRVDKLQKQLNVTSNIF